MLTVCYSCICQRLKFPLVYLFLSPLLSLDFHRDFLIRSEMCSSFHCISLLYRSPIDMVAMCVGGGGKGYYSPTIRFQSFNKPVSLGLTFTSASQFFPPVR